MLKYYTLVCAITCFFGRKTVDSISPDDDSFWTQYNLENYQPLSY